MAELKFEMIKKSSQLEGAHYDRQSKNLTLKFKSGDVYRYAKVPAALWTKFKKTFDGKTSAGSFLHVEIKPKFKYVKVELEEE